MKSAADIQLLFGLVITYFVTYGWIWMFENFTFFYFMWWQLYMIEAVVSISRMFNTFKWLSVCDYSYDVIVTLILLMWRIWWDHSNASKGQVGFNSPFKGLIKLWNSSYVVLTLKCIFMLSLQSGNIWYFMFSVCLRGKIWNTVYTIGGKSI
jgi:hypothetical protein